MTLDVLQRGPRRAVAHLYDRRHMVAPRRVRHPGHQRVVHVRMGLQGLLDLLGVHLLAPGVDALRAAPEDHDHALLVDGRHVAEQHPAFAVLAEEGLGRLRRVVVVAERNVAALGDPPYLARGDRLAGGRIDHPGTGVDADPEAALGPRVVRRRAVEPGLRGAEVVQQHRVRHQRPELAADRVRHDRAGRGHAEHRRAVRAPQGSFERVDQRPQHRVAHQGDAGDLLPLDRPQYFLGHELAVDHHTLTEVEADEGGEGGGAVHQWRGGEEGDPRTMRPRPARRSPRASSPVHRWVSRRPAPRRTGPPDATSRPWAGRSCRRCR